MLLLAGHTTRGLVAADVDTRTVMTMMTVACNSKEKQDLPKSFPLKKKEKCSEKGKDCLHERHF